MRYYSAEGKEETQELRSVAKNDGKHYWIKRTPMGFFYDPTNHMHVKAQRETRLNYQYEHVNASTFELYVSYLQTKNPARLRMAERAYNESQIDRSR